MGHSAAPGLCSRSPRLLRSWASDAVSDSSPCSFLFDLWPFSLLLELGPLVGLRVLFYDRFCGGCLGLLGAVRSPPPDAKKGFEILTSFYDIVIILKIVFHKEPTQVCSSCGLGLCPCQTKVLPSDRAAFRPGCVGRGRAAAIIIGPDFGKSSHNDTRGRAAAIIIGPDFGKSFRKSGARTSFICPAFALAAKTGWGSLPRTVMPAGFAGPLAARAGFTRTSKIPESLR